MWPEWVACSSFASEFQPRRRNAPKLSGGHCNHSWHHDKGTQGWREDAITSPFVIKWVAVATSVKQDCLEGCCESLCGRMGGLPVFCMWAQAEASGCPEALRRAL